MAIHTRAGMGANAPPSGNTQDDTSGFFQPKMNNEEDMSTAACPFWTLLARTRVSLTNSVEFIALPGYTSFGQDAADGFYLRSEIILPKGYEVSNIAFYGDDGNSSLSPDLNDETQVKEGRQSIGFVITSNDELSQEVQEELWLFQYDGIVFEKVESKRNIKNEVVIPNTESNERVCTYLTMSHVEDSDESNRITPKSEYHIMPFANERRISRMTYLCLFLSSLIRITSFHHFLGRHIGTHRKNSSQMHQQQQSQINLCGSRGTGSVVTFGQSTFMNIFDLEEDDDNASSVEGDNE